MSYLLAGNQKQGRIGPLPIPTSLGTALTAAEPLLFTDMVLSNRTAGPLTVTIHVVPAGAVASNNTMLLDAVNLPGNDLINYSSLNIPLSLQDSIQFLASGAGLNFFGTVSRQNR